LRVAGPFFLPSERPDPQLATLKLSHCAPDRSDSSPFFPLAKKAAFFLFLDEDILLIVWVYVAKFILTLERITRFLPPPPPPPIFLPERGPFYKNPPPRFVTQVSEQKVPFATSHLTAGPDDPSSLLLSSFVVGPPIDLSPFVAPAYVILSLWVSFFSAPGWLPAPAAIPTRPTFAPGFCCVCVSSLSFFDACHAFLLSLLSI